MPGTRPGMTKLNADIRCVCSDSRKRLAAILVRLLRLVVNQPRNLAQALAVARATDNIADAAVGPEHRAVLVLRGVAHLRRLCRGLRGVDREALARRALIHQERRWPRRSRQQPAA